jgi:two-component system cell cycle sensor histidine kinase/response regulator CckA
MQQGPHEAAPRRVASSAMLQLRGPFLTLVAALLVAVSASVTAGFIGIGHLDRALRGIAANDVQRLLLTTHVRRLFRSELVLVHELDNAGEPGRREALEQRRAAVQRERAALLAKLRVLGIPDQERALQTLEEEHRDSRQTGFRYSSRWETAIASILTATESRLARAVADAESRGRTARVLLIAASSLAAALALALGGAVLRRVRSASRTLAASEEQFRRVVESAPSLLAILSPTQTLSFLPARGPAFLGVSRERLQAEPLCWVDPEDRPQLQARLDEALRPSAGAATVGLRARRDDASTWQASVSVTPLGAEHGLAGVVLQILDVTQQYEAEKARLALEAQLRQSQKMESVGRLAGGVAHDFNNLLTAILGYASLAQLGGGAAKPEYIEGIVAAAERAAALTRQLLAFSRKHVIAPLPTALDELIRRLETLLVRLIGEDVRLEVRAQPDLGRCLVDANQVEQVILNLAVNARDAMPNGGTLRIEARNAELDQGYVDRHPDAKAGRYVLLAVSDTGVGMSREVQSRLFEPFFTTKPRGQGTGLGLSVVYGTVHQHGGTIDVSSEPGLGTTVRIYWPRIEGDSRGAVVAPAQKASPRGTESILLVEDDPLVRDFTAAALASHGYEVLVADDAAEALRLASERSTPPRLLLTDVILPDRNGCQLAKDLAIRWPEMPVLFCSGYSDRLMTQSGRLSPGVDYLQKPYDATTLVSRVRAAIDSAGIVGGQPRPMASRWQAE